MLKGLQNIFHFQSALVARACLTRETQKSFVSERKKEKLYWPDRNKCKVFYLETRKMTQLSLVDSCKSEKLLSPEK